MSSSQHDAVCTARQRGARAGELGAGVVAQKRRLTAGGEALAQRSHSAANLPTGRSPPGRFLRRGGGIVAACRPTCTRGHSRLPGSWPRSGTHGQRQKTPNSGSTDSPAPSAHPPGHWGPKAPASQESGSERPTGARWGSDGCPAGLLAERNAFGASCLQPPSESFGARGPVPQLKERAAGARKTGPRVPQQLLL